MNTMPFYIARTPLLTFADAQKKRFRLIPLVPCFHKLEDGNAPLMFICQGLGDARFPRIPVQEYYRKKIRVDVYGTYACPTPDLRTVKGLASFLTGTGNVWTLPHPRIKMVDRHSGYTPPVLIEPFLFAVDGMTIVCMLQTSPNRSFKPEYIVHGLEDEFKSIHAHELVNRMSLFGENVFLSGINALGPTMEELEKLSYEKSIQDKNLTFRQTVGLD